MNKLFFSIYNHPNKAIQDRCKAYYPFIDSKYFRNHKSLKALSLVIGKIQILFGVDRLKNNPLAPIYHGLGWFSIPHDFAVYAVSQKESVEKTFRYTLAADEAWIHSVAIHSDFKERVYAYHGEHSPVDASKCFQDWKRGKPYTFTADDYDLLMRDNPGFFARKFSDSHKEIVDMIFDELSKQQSLIH